MGKFRKLDRLLMLSEEMLNKGLSAEALGCLAYIYGTHKDEEPIQLNSLLITFKLGQSKWARISRELRDAGIMKLERTSRGSRLICIDY